MRKPVPATKVYEFAPFRLDPCVRHLLCDDKRIVLTTKVFDILLLLVQRHGEVVEKEEIIQEVWPNSYVEESNLTVHISTLRKALGENRPDHTYIETVPRRGYRFVARVSEAFVKLQHPRSGWGGAKRRSTPERAIRSLAVLPFTNTSPNRCLEYFSDGLTESIINSLSQLRRLRVIARNTAFLYKGREVDVEELRRRLGVRGVLQGRVVQLDGRINISVNLIDVTDGSHLWGEHYNCDLTKVFEAQKKIALAISEQLQLRLTGIERRGIVKPPTKNNEAYKCYMKGRYCWNKRSEDGLVQAIKYFKRSAELDPEYALAYSGLADNYNLLISYGLMRPDQAMPEIKGALEKALSLDVDLSEAHATNGYVKMMYEWDWAGAEQEFKRAIVLRPRYVVAHHWYAIYLRLTGRMADSLDQWEQALDLDPLSLHLNCGLGVNHYFARQHEQAITQLQEVLELEPHYYVALTGLGAAWAEKGNYEQALAALQKSYALVPNPETLSMIGYTYGLKGDKIEAERVLLQLNEEAQHRYVAPYYMAIICAALAQKDQAFFWLEKAFKDQDLWLVTLKIDPRLDKLRDNPRFADLLRRIGLAP